MDLYTSVRPLEQSSCGYLTMVIGLKSQWVLPTWKKFKFIRKYCVLWASCFGQVQLIRTFPCEKVILNVISCSCWMFYPRSETHYIDKAVFMLNSVPQFETHESHEEVNLPEFESKTIVVEFLVGPRLGFIESLEMVSKMLRDAFFTRQRYWWL